VTDHADIFGTTISCECGRTHHIEPERIVYAAGAVGYLPELLAECTRGRRTVVLMDARTREAAGAEAAEQLRQAGWQAAEIIVPDSPAGASPVCDDQTHDELAGRVADADAIVGAGSGVISDLAKWLAHDLGLRYACVATAASMNGYTSANVALSVAGVKTLRRARPPYAVVADPAVIASAPWEMTAAGLGDLLAKSVSSADWRMNHLLFGDYFCRRSVALVGEIEPRYMDRPERLRSRDPQATAALFHALLLTGAAMTMAETSAPASGAEHLVSHTLDMMSSLDGTPHDLHGRQVGVGTVLASALYRRVLDLESPEFRDPGEADAAFWGRLAPAILPHYREKLPRLHAARRALLHKNAWDRLREELQPLLRAPEEVRGCLQRARAAFRAEDIGCSRERLLAAFVHAHEMRPRFTILDLARLVGVMPDAAAQIVEEWG